MAAPQVQVAVVAGLLRSRSLNKYMDRWDSALDNTYTLHTK